MQEPNKIIPLAEPDLRGREEEYVVKCIRDGWISSSGSFVNKFELLIAKHCKCNFGIAVSSGTAAINLLLQAMGLKKGHHVILPDWTFAATANAIIHAGMIPFFADVSAMNGTLDAVSLKRAFTDAKNRNIQIGAVIVVHPMGIVADMAALKEICANENIPLIEDAAGALGSKYNGYPAGGIGDAGIISFNGNKLVTAGGGGMIVTNNKGWANKALKLSTQSRIGTRYHHDDVGYNFRLTNVCAAIGVAQVERLDEMIALRKKIALRYDAAIKGRKDLRPPKIGKSVNWNAWMYSLQTATAKDADKLVKHLNTNKIGARHFWSNLSGQKPYSNYPKTLFGNSTTLSETLVSLPCSSNLLSTDISTVIDAINLWEGKTHFS